MRWHPRAEYLSGELSGRLDRLRQDVRLQLLLLLVQVLLGHPHGHQLARQVVAMGKAAVLQQPAQEGVVRPLLEAQRAAVPDVLAEPRRQAPAQLLHGGGLLLLADPPVLLLLGARLDALPRQLAEAEVHQHVADALQVIAAALLGTQVVVDAGVSGRADQLLTLPVGNVVVALRVAVLLCEPEVNHVHFIVSRVQANREIFGFDVPMDEVFGVR
mmetsp:Transcript_46340/g.131036  ORF Transcript_46340/g.131036 Transcript_46340/m.131036 type:complete len:215 (+) Transcript_46340:273-917(+)